MSIHAAGKSSVDSDSVPTKATLSWPHAILNAFFGIAADFYPRIVSKGAVASYNSLNIMNEMGDSQSWAFLDSEGLDKALELARQSLNEVKTQTEYQDQKATRLLTITTFLTAFSGVLFTRFEDSYSFLKLDYLPLGQQAIVWLAYALFAAFILSALSGALVIFHATRTRFKYRSFNTAEQQEADPASLEFYSALIAVRPRAWLKAWVREEPTRYGYGKLKVRTDLRARYLHNLVTETYLVAAKTADKLRYLQPGQSLLATSLRCLFLWLVVLAAVLTSVPVNKVATEPAKVRIEGPVELVPQSNTAGSPLKGADHGAMQGGSNKSRS